VSRSSPWQSLIRSGKPVYQTVLGLQPAYESGEQVGYYLGDIILMLKSNWDASPTENPNPRITRETNDAR